RKATGVPAGHMVEDQQVVVAETFRRLGVVAHDDGVIADLGLREDDPQLHASFLSCADLVRGQARRPGDGSASDPPPAIATPSAPSRTADSAASLPLTVREARASIPKALSVRAAGPT